jgi:LuxR family maltose regulon positive regulatory protein
MFAPILTTKLYIPPQRSDAVPRPRLLTRLNAGLAAGCKLTLISAPAGFGKTTLLSEWISRRGAGTPPLQHVAWLSLDEGDNDPVRFLTYLVAALQQAYEAIGQSVPGLLQSSQLPLAGSGPQADADPMEAPVAALVNDIIEAAKPLVLVLDDYHLIHAAPVRQIVQLLLKRQPPQMHLVVSTREEPVLQLPRLRAQGQVTEIGERDLRFTAAEATTLLNGIMGLRLSPEAVAALEARTEGWFVGLQLAALSLQDCQDADAFVAAFSGDDRHVTDYLVEEVLHHQPPHVQTFLLQTSILERLCGPLCDAVVDWQLDAGSRAPSASQPVLEYLERANLFIVPLDNKRQWYRYHRLFADLLYHRLRGQHPDRLAGLHRRASRWYEQMDDVEEAVHHALAIPDIPLAVHLMEQYGSRVLDRGQITTLLNWLQQIPDDVLCANPRLCTGCGWAYALTGQVERAERYVEAGEAALSAFEPLYIASMDHTVTRKEVQADLNTIRAYCARLRGDSAGVIRYSKQALEQLPADEYGTRAALALNLGLLHQEEWNLDAARMAFSEAFEMALKSEENTYVAVIALSMQGDLLTTQGNLQEAAECYRQAIELGAQGLDAVSPTPAVCHGHLGLAEIHYQRNELAAAASHLEKALESAQQTGNREMIVAVSLLRPRLALAFGDPAQVEVLLDQADKFVQDHGIEYHDASRTATRGELYLAQGDVDAAAQLIAERDLQPAKLATGGGTSSALWDRLPEYVLLARVMLAQGQPDTALALLADLTTAAEASGHAVVLIEAAILQAVAQHRKRNDAQALQHLEHALALAEPQGYVRPFLSAGKQVDALLRQVIARGVRATYAGQVLAAFVAPARERGAPLASDAVIEPLYERLTKREQQVLRLLATGLSSTEVAEELVIAVSTVRSYIKVIYRKLDVHSRDEAITRGRQLGLL